MSFMANENNNINELVADDDPTAELEILSFAKNASDIETDAKTCNSEEEAGNRHLAARSTVPELESELQSRKKLIGRLQFDFEQLHAKWLGLQAEVSARESQTVQINDELVSSQEVIAQKNKLIKKQDRKIKGLKSRISQLDENYSQLESRFDDLLLTVSDTTPSRENERESSALIDSDQRRYDLVSQLQRTEEYADTIRQQSLDLIEKNSRAGREVDSLSNRLTEITEQNVQISDRFSSATSEVEELKSTLGMLQDRHAEEAFTRRNELINAQSELTQAEETNRQLASDLTDAQSVTDELERMLGNVEKQSAERIDQLEQEVSRLTDAAGGLDQKLAAKSEAISILLAEIAKKAERIDPVGEIGEVIQNIDERLSEHKSKINQFEQTPDAEKLSRVLIGTVDDRTLRFPLFKKRLTIGRTRDNDIQIKAVYVSRRHAVIQTDGDVTRIIDWGSKNGIRVNSANVSEHFLCHGDTIIIGNARFRYEERKKRDSH